MSGKVTRPPMLPMLMTRTEARLRIAGTFGIAELGPATPASSSVTPSIPPGAPLAEEETSGKKKGKGKKKKAAPAAAEAVPAVAVDAHEDERRRLCLRLATVYGDELARIDDAVAKLKDIVASRPNDEEASHQLELLLRRTDRRDDLRWLFDLRAPVPSRTALAIAVAAQDIERARAGWSGGKHDARARAEALHPRRLVGVVVQVQAVDREAFDRLVAETRAVLVQQEAAVEDGADRAALRRFAGEVVGLEPQAEGAFPFADHPGKAVVAAGGDRGLDGAMAESA